MQSNIQNSWYGISNRFIELVIKNEEGELSPKEYQEKGEILAQELKNKGTSTQGYIISQEAEIKAIKEEIKRLKEYADKKEKRIERIKSNVKDALENLGIQKLETPIGTMSIAKNPPSVEIYDESLIPKEYKKEKVVIDIDKAAIKDALKNGKNVQGAKLIEDKTRLNIR